MCLRLVLWPCTLLAPPPSSAVPRLTTTVDRVRKQNTVLEQRAERFRGEARNLENTLVAYHLARCKPSELRKLNKGERERVRALLIRRERALAESIKYERMALVLSSTITSLHSSACVHDVARALGEARGVAAAASRKLERINVDELMAELEDHRDVAEQYSDALTQGEVLQQLNDEEIDQRLEELIVDPSLHLEHIERVAAKLERAPSPPTNQPPRSRAKKRIAAYAL